MYTPYDPAFLVDFKAEVPYTARRWNNGDKVWIVSAQYGQALRDLILAHFRFNISAPSIRAQAVEVTRLVKLMYVGVPKPRGDDGEPLAYGWVDGGWTTIWPLSVLRSWFEPIVYADEARPGDAPTLYAVLGLERKASQVAIKPAWRKLARRWHPDMNRDNDAKAQMQRVNDAYEVLKDVGRRARYDVGLKLQAAAGRSATLPTQSNAWRPPYRCGMVLVTGIEEIGRLNVHRILQWGDIVDGQGRILVTYWKYGDDEYSERWV
jgi:hypothetical protein